MTIIICIEVFLITEKNVDNKGNNCFFFFSVWMFSLNFDKYNSHLKLPKIKLNVSCSFHKILTFAVWKYVEGNSTDQ